MRMPVVSSTKTLPLSLRASTAEEDGYLFTLTTDMNADASYCLMFDVHRVADGLVCKIQLPERISSGTHSTWVAGSELRCWRH
jgi:carotenoid cleavage dioxygenase-like enzyme